ncbi:Wzz/FepE/Etk N-terminal domain-containing protein [Vibrio amylolyticus]|uniref:Wzz/FepE/Etk N-terminal domain-containing protein n=1 Tax=Vibrio amylolyticus TaxID=2847292 RepID=UPI00354DF76F
MCNQKHASAQQHNDDNEFVDLKSILNLIWKNKWWVALTAVSVAFASGLFGFDSEETYESQAIITATFDPNGFQEDAGFEKGVWTSSANPTLSYIINLSTFQQAMKNATGLQGEDLELFQVGIESSTQVNVRLTSAKSKEDAFSLMERYLSALHEQLKNYERERINKQLNVVQVVLDSAVTPMEKQVAYELLVMRKIKLVTLEQISLFEVNSVIESSSTKNNWLVLSIIGGMFGMFFSIAVMLLYSILRRN